MRMLMLSKDHYFMHDWSLIKAYFYYPLPLSSYSMTFHLLYILEVLGDHSVWLFHKVIAGHWCENLILEYFIIPSALCIVSIVLP